jgi:hypothetical protein
VANAPKRGGTPFRLKTARSTISRLGGRAPPRLSSYPQSGSTHAARQHRFRRPSRPIEPGHHVDGSRNARLRSRGPDLRGAIRGRLPAPPMASWPRQPRDNCRRQSLSSLARTASLIGTKFTGLRDSGWMDRSSARIRGRLDRRPLVAASAVLRGCGTIIRQGSALPGSHNRIAAERIARS